MKKILTLTSTILMLTFTVTAAFAAAPVLFYSDLESGPKTGGQGNLGAFVTIWGRNFGATRGTSHVSVGGGQADNYPVWTDTKIAFQLGANANSGNIIVTTPEGGSNGLTFTVRGGNIYFAKTTGNDSNDGSWNSPWRTIIKLKNSLAAGDIGYICDGVSQTTEDSTQTYGAFVNLGSHGTAGNPKALVAYPGATVQIGNDSLGRGIHNWESGYGPSTYWVLSQLNIRCTATGIHPNTGFRIVGNRITCPNGDSSSGTAGIEGFGSDLYILGNELYNIGKPSSSKLYHNIYIDDNCNNVEIAWNTIRDSTANRGVQFYSTNQALSNVRIHNNLFYNLKGNAINISSNASGTYQIYNNIIYQCALGPSFYDGMSMYNGIYINYNNATIYLYNNLVYDCGYSGAANDSGLLYIYNYSGTLYPRNNIFYSNGASYENYMAPDSSNPPSGAYKNLFYGKGSAPSWDTAAVNADPKFIDLAGRDFHLQSTSPAKDTGYNTASVVPRDYDGVIRPQYSVCDIGPYEYGSGDTPPPPVNNSPVLSSIGNKSVNENATLSFTVSATDIDGDTLTYSASNLPGGASFNTSTRVFTWTPSFSQAGTYNNVTFSVSDGSGGTDAEAITITVNNVNRAPVLSAIGNKSVAENSNLSFIVSATDADGDTLTYSASNLPAGASFNTSTRVFSWTPSDGQAGTYTAVYFEVTDGGLSDSENITITVSNANIAPVLSAIGNKTTAENGTLSFTISATDADGDTVTYSAGNLPSGASFNTSTRLFTWTPTYTQAGTYNNVTFSVSDGNGGTDSEAIIITVNNVNRAPVLNAIGNRSIAENSTLTFTISASDPDGDSLTYSASNLPSGASFNAWTRIFTWTPDYSQAGTYTAVHFQASDGSLTDSEDITITVTNTNRAPVLAAIGNKTVAENETLTLTVSATDADGDALTYSAANLPAGAFFNTSTRVFNWTPSDAQAGTYPGIRFLVSDGAFSDYEDITITVSNVNKAPVLNEIGNKTVNEAALLQFVISATDEDGDSLSYSASGLPQGATFSASSRLFSWTPNYAQAGDYSVTFNVDDGKGGSDSENIIITVNNMNRNPVLASIGNKNINENSNLSFTISASDPDLDPLTYSASGLPGGATFNSATRTFAWTPGFTTTGTYNVTFTVDDGNGGTDSESIVITVNNTNRAPVLSAIGNKTLDEGATLTFTVSATDADGDSLSYATSELPTGATFISETFAWVPASSQADIYDMTFSVTDGQGGSDAETITITVNDVPEITVNAQATPTDGNIPLTVNFTVAASSINGPIVRYEWDFEGKGFYSWTSSVSGNTSYTYAGAGPYTPTVKVTDPTGTQDTYALLVQAQAPANTPTVEASVNKNSGTAPLRVSFRVNAQPKKDIVRYEWDFEGDGVYDYKSTKSGNAVKTYTQGGTYLATVKVTNDSAISTTREILITVGDNPASPNVSLNISKKKDVTSTEKVNFAIQTTSTDIVRYEWDFEGDGVYDASSYNKAAMQQTFGHAGTFKPKVKVTTKEGLSSTFESEVTVSEDPLAIKTAASFAMTNAAGETPLNIDFTSLSNGPVALTYWDFDGNKHYDAQGLSKSHLYKEPGYYMVNFAAATAEGLIDMASKQIKVTSVDKKVVLLSPRDSEILKGSVTLAIFIDPRIEVQQVIYQVMPSGFNDWQDIGASNAYPYSVVWDTTGINNSAYIIRAHVEDGINFVTDSVTVLVDNLTTTPTSQEGIDNYGQYKKLMAIDSSETQNAYLYDGTQAEIPYQATDTDDTLTIVISDASQLSQTLKNYSYVLDLNQYREISLASNKKLLNKEVRLIFPYDDQDNDGYVDGTTVKEETLDIYLYDEDIKGWRKLFDCIVRLDENFVEAKTNHFSLFGLGGIEDTLETITGEEGKGGGCFIATACFGSKMAEEVQILSRFRDKYLLTNAPGRAWVRFYYKHSPPIADYIRDKNCLKGVVRTCLKPLVALSKRMVK
jgi:PKD repeat protein